MESPIDSPVSNSVLFPNARSSVRLSISKVLIYVLVSFFSICCRAIPLYFQCDCQRCSFQIVGGEHL